VENARIARRIKLKIRLAGLLAERDLDLDPNEPIYTQPAFARLFPINGGMEMTDFAFNTQGPDGLATFLKVRASPRALHLSSGMVIVGRMAEILNLKAVASNGDEVYFRLTETTPLRKLMLAFCARQGVQMSDVHFIFRDVEISQHDELYPVEFGMQDGDVIDCQLPPA